MRHILILKDEHSRASECSLGWLWCGGGLAWVGLGGLESLGGLDGRGGWIPTQPCTNLPRHPQTTQQEIKGLTKKNPDLWESLVIAHTFCLCLFLTSIFHPAIVEKHLLKKISFFPAESDPGIARPLHLFPLPVLNASKLTMISFWCCCVGSLKKTKLFQRFQCFSLCKACRGGRGLAGTKAG